MSGKGDFSASLAQADIGPALPPRFEVYRLALELRTLADQACEATYAGPKCDVRAALRKLDAARALLGGGE